MSRYRFIHEEKAAYAVTLLCRVLRVARSAYYAWARCGVSARARADAAVVAENSIRIAWPMPSHCPLILSSQH